MSMPVRKQLLVASAVAASALSLITGCSRAVDGTAVREGAGPRNNDSEQAYPNLLKECDVLTTDVIAKTVGADPADIQSTFVGAVCRWQAANPGGLIDITRFWFEQGSLDNEKKIAGALNYQIENRNIAGVPSIVMRTSDPNGCVRGGQRRRRSGGLVGEPAGPRYRCMRPGDQADGADARHQFLTRHVERRQRGAAGFQRAPRSADPQHRHG